jgi:hypothetical protein
MITATVRIAVAALLTSLVFVPAATAGGGGGCTSAAPTVSVDNNYAWGSPGSWGMPGQQLTYAIKVTNNDAGCGSSTFVVGLAAPAGFSVSVPTSSISLGSTSSGYVFAQVTSPAVVADGDYTLAATVQRAGSATASAKGTSYYKVYSSDTTPPTLFFPNPWANAVVSGKSYNVAVSSSDDHAVKKIELYIDNAKTPTTTATCADISYQCQLFYKWSLGKVTKGDHTIRFYSYDWMGNFGSLTVNFTVS